jgi:hexulose-6-phosphate isomerase
MKTRLGIMQGRLSPPKNGKIQTFPVNTWEREFQTARDLGLGGIEWTVDADTFRKHPLIDSSKYELVKILSSNTDLYINTVTCDFFMQLEPWQSESGLSKIYEMLITLSSIGNQINGLIMIIPLVDKGSPVTTHDWLRLDEFLKKLEPVLVKNKSRIAFEFDIEPYRQLEFLAKINTSIFGVNFDSGNSASNGFNPTEELARISPYIFNVHIKDRTYKGNTVALGTGDTDFEKISKFFSQNLYNGHFILQGARIAGQTEEQTALQYIDFCKRLQLS